MALYVVTGPPAAGKSTWVRERAKYGDVTIDFDELAMAFGPECGDRIYPKHVETVTHAARNAAIDAALQLSRLIDVYVIHTEPSPKQLGRYDRLGAEILTVDPGRDVVFDRCRRERPARLLKVAEDWYDAQNYVPI